MRWLAAERQTTLSVLALTHRAVKAHILGHPDNVAQSRAPSRLGYGDRVIAWSRFEGRGPQGHRGEPLPFYASDPLWPCGSRASLTIDCRRSDWAKSYFVHLGDAQALRNVFRPGLD